MAEIVSYDRAERNDAYIGEINMLQASLFSYVAVLLTRAVEGGLKHPEPRRDSTRASGAM